MSGGGIQGVDSTLNFKACPSMRGCDSYKENQNQQLMSQTTKLVLQQMVTDCFHFFFLRETALILLS